MTLTQATTSRKVLAVDDSQVNLTLLKVHLDRMGLSVSLATNMNQAMEIARTSKPDLVLLDIMMPEIDGFEGCRMLKADPQTMDIPVIFISAKDQTTDKVTGLQLGAVDYITKPFDPSELKARINLVLQTVTLQEQLEERANTDELTGLTNRRYFTEILHREILHSESNNKPLSLIMSDIDHFKQINDTYGHLGGDVVLRQVSDVLRENVAPMDVVGRFGGEEFIIVMPQTPHEQAMIAAEKLRKQIEQCHWKISAEPVTVTVSMGVASIDNQHSPDAGDLVKRADMALYLAKKSGRNRVISSLELERNNDSDTTQNHNIREIIRQVNKLRQELRDDALNGIVSILDDSIIQQGLRQHNENVAHYAEIIAEQFGLAQEFINELKIAAKLHDIGKIALPIEILTQPEQDDVYLQEIYEQHPLLGIRLLEPLEMFQREQLYIKHHHERFDGQGYPDGLADKKIPFGARILAVADTFDRLTYDSSGGPAPHTQEQAIEIIATGSNGKFDPAVVEAFLNAVRNHSLNLAEATS